MSRLTSRWKRQSGIHVRDAVIISYGQLKSRNPRNLENTIAKKSHLAVDGVWSDLSLITITEISLFFMKPRVCRPKILLPCETLCSA